MGVEYWKKTAQRCSRKYETVMAHVRPRKVDLQLEIIHDARKIVSLVIAGAISPLRSLAEGSSPFFFQAIAERRCQHF